jgi:hypothetical protein
MGLNGIELDVVDLFRLAEDRNHFLFIANTAVNIQVQ